MALVVWRKVGAVCALLICCVFLGVWQDADEPLVGKSSATLAAGKLVLLIREDVFILKNFLSKCFGFILCTSKISIIVLQNILPDLRAGTFLDVSCILLHCVITLPRE